MRPIVRLVHPPIVFVLGLAGGALGADFVSDGVFVPRCHCFGCHGEFAKDPHVVSIEECSARCGSADECKMVCAAHESSV